MPLVSGAKLGLYEVEGPQSVGGTGEVYRAKDTCLNRSVASKILPAQCSAHPVHKQRFERDDKTTSGLNHPRICILQTVGYRRGHLG